MKGKHSEDVSSIKVNVTRILKEISENEFQKCYESSTQGRRAYERRAEESTSESIALLRGITICLNSPSLWFSLLHKEFRLTSIALKQ